MPFMCASLYRYSANVHAKAGALKFVQYMYALPDKVTSLLGKVHGHARFIHSIRSGQVCKAQWYWMSYCMDVRTCVSITMHEIVRLAYDAHERAVHIFQIWEPSFHLLYEYTRARSASIRNWESSSKLRIIIRSDAEFHYHRNRTIGIKQGANAYGCCHIKVLDLRIIRQFQLRAIRNK